MELLIAERVRENRKRMGWTQEELAGRLGVTPQAVSYWEKGGYPDITMLPDMAGLFGITVDELIGRDDGRIREEYRQYRETMRTLDLPDRFRHARAFYKRYPSDLNLALELLIYYGVLPREERAKHALLVRDAAGKILASRERVEPENRLAALRILAGTSEGEERERWLGQFTDSQAYSAVLMRCVIAQDDSERDALKWLGLDSLFKLRFVFNTVGAAHALGPVNAEAKERFILRALEGFGDGTAPDGWLNTRGMRLACLAAALFAQSRIEEGFEALEESLGCFARWRSFSEETPLELGAPWLFFGVRGSRALYRFFLPDGSSYEAFPHDVFPDEELFRQTLSDPYEDWFDGVREDPRFKRILEEAERLLSEGR